MDDILTVTDLLRESLLDKLFDSSSTYIREQTDVFNKNFNKLIRMAPNDVNLKEAHSKLSIGIEECMEKADGVSEVVNLKFKLSIEARVKKIMAAIDDSLAAPLDESKWIEAITDNDYHMPIIMETVTEMTSYSEYGFENVKTCVDSITQTITLYEKAITDDSEDVALNLLLDFQQKIFRLRSEIHEKSLSHIEAALASCKEHAKLEEMEQKIYDCAELSNNVVAVAHAKFIEITEELQRKTTDLIERAEDMNVATIDDGDDLYNMYKIGFKETIDSLTASAEEILSGLERDSILVPNFVKSCVDAVVNSSQYSSEKVEL